MCEPLVVANGVEKLHALVHPVLIKEADVNLAINEKLSGTIKLHNFDLLFWLIWLVAAESHTCCSYWFELTLCGI